MGETDERSLGANWSIDIPEGWEQEREDDVATFFDPDGVGALQFSTVIKTEGGDVTDNDLHEFIGDLNLADVPREAAAHGSFVGYSLGTELESGSACRSWFLRAGTLLLYATYICGKEHVGREDAAVGSALDSLRLA